ncbi:hypothetical protein BGZ57DRAFT_860083 [Hyaloscypha finlandica]|nr:hypothetical protein BGZ57DRAFT_860083 [Hyaloscypha finlandica]
MDEEWSGLASALVVGLSGHPACKPNLQASKGNPRPRMCAGCIKKFPDGNIDAEQGRVWRCNLPNGWWGPGPLDGSLAIRLTQLLSDGITMGTVASRVLADLADG